MVGLKLFVEGGGDANSLHRRCREGFRSFLEKSGLKGNMPRVVSCGGRKKAYDRFQDSWNRGFKAILLVDSEGPVNATSPWEHLRNRDNWDMPINSQDEHCHLMVQCMEAWLIADIQELSNYFMNGFKNSALPKNNNIEDIPKQDVLQALQKATSKCRVKYEKGEVSFSLLKLIDPSLVKNRSVWAKRFLDSISALVSQRQ